MMFLVMESVMTCEKALAAILQSQVRTADYCLRIGGDEFLLCLRGRMCRLQCAWWNVFVCVLNAIILRLLIGPLLRAVLQRHWRHE